MAIPGYPEARLFYRCAFQRFDDAQVLLRADHTTGAVYLAGYAVDFHCSCPFCVHGFRRMKAKMPQGAVVRIARSIASDWGSETWF